MDLRTGCAFWVLKNGLLASYPALANDVATDVVVLGAGVTGALVAHALTKNGVDVIVLDRRDVASGSTAATTGLLQYETDATLQQLATRFGIDTAVRVYRLGLDAIARIETLCDELGDHCGFARRPSLYVAETRRDADALSREHALRREHGFDVDFLSASSLRARFGFSAPAALFSRGDGEIDCFRFTHRLLMKAAAAGARIYDRTAVKRIRAREGGVELTTAGGPRVRANRVVYATGYEAVEHTNVPTKLTSTFACVTEPLAVPHRWEERCLIWETSRPYFYLRTTDDDRAIIGGADARFATRHRSERVLSAKQRVLMKCLRSMFPGVAAEPAYMWGGVFAETRDSLPFIGSRGNSRELYALGYGANGITFAMIAAHILRDHHLGRTNPDAATFSFNRSLPRRRMR
jgi:glycine/D-amino acid oxidase-like deaminating enzyme